MAIYLLIVNESFYPSPGTDDWFGSYDTWENAEKAAALRLWDNDGYTSFVIVDLLDLVNQPEGEKVQEE